MAFLRHVGGQSTVSSAPVIFIILLFCCALAASGAPAPPAFNPFPTHGIGMTPGGFISGITTYTLTVSSGAHLSSGGYQYPITLVWGFYAVNDTGDSANNFQASGESMGQWTWDDKGGKSGFSVAGWLDAPKKQAIITPVTGSVSKAFDFSGLAVGGEAPRAGLHVTVSIPNGAPSPFGGGETGDILPIPSAPEPSGLTAVASGLLLALGGIAHRRRRFLS